ncbi:MAG: hypothetical protein IT368_10040, partial [Candidatus Hydrogenedentes bacterium]|nr:hypothetical protein [Candidatus Hydrogenedentota bacterium]
LQGGKRKPANRPPAAEAPAEEPRHVPVEEPARPAPPQQPAPRPRRPGKRGEKGKEAMVDALLRFMGPKDE